MTILTKKGSARQHIVWYPAGAGGMWLNYLIWVHQHGRTIDYPFKHFEFKHVAGQEPGYRNYLTFARHTDSPEVGTIRLGSNHAWYNFYININLKKGMAEPAFLYQGCIEILRQADQNIPFNLDWRLIWSNPEQFIKDLAEITRMNIELNSLTERAIEQYRQTCYLPELTKEFCRSDLYKYWHQAIIDTRTDAALTYAERDSQALDITRELYWPGC